MEAQDLPIEIRLPNLPAEAQSVIQGFAFEAALQIGLPLDLISAVVVDPTQKGSKSEPNGARPNQTFRIRIAQHVFWTIYQRRGHWNQRDDIDGADQLNIYIFYHELGHCLDERKRQVFDREEPLDTEPYSRQICANWNEQVLLSDYAASSLASIYLGKEGFVQAVEDFQREESTILQGIGSMPAVQQAGYMWKLLIEYAKLSAVANGNAWPRSTSRLIGSGLSGRFKILHETLSKLWLEYPNWQNVSTGAFDLWLEVCKRVGANAV